MGILKKIGYIYSKATDDVPGEDRRIRLNM
jgi:hypothetical protein